MQLSYLQLFGVVLAISIIWLDTQENILARPLSLLGTAMALFVYYPAGLYAKCLLNCIYIVLNIYGWYQWAYGGKDKSPLQVSKTNAANLIFMLAASTLGALALGKFLHQFSNADLAYWDSLHTALCLMAQWLLVRKKLESWVLWIVADVLYTVVCYYKALYVFSALHAFYIIMAIYGYRAWLRTYLEHSTSTNLPD